VGEAQAILQSLQAGVVPRAGLQHLAVGRVDEVRQLLRELQAVAAGAGAFKLILGPYGAGKTFLLALARQAALAQGFLVADADLGPDLRLTGEGRGLATYRELLARLSSAARPAGGALPVLLDRWAEGVRAHAAASVGTAPTGRTPALSAAVNRALGRQLADLSHPAGGPAFAAVLRVYFEAALAGEDERVAACIRWLRGEMRAAGEVRAALGVAAPAPADGDWYERLRLLALLAAQAGFAGLVVVLDEAVHLYRLAQPQARARNYEVVLRLLNATLQGDAPHMAVYLAGPPELLSDPYRGLVADPALRSRLAPNELADADHRDLAQPVLAVQPLDASELLALLQKVLAIHRSYYGSARLRADDAAAFLRELLARPGAVRHLTARDAVRGFLHLCNLAQQHPDLDVDELLRRAAATVTSADGDDERFVTIS
jgi:hypothetical protein